MTFPERDSRRQDGVGTTDDGGALAELGRALRSLHDGDRAAAEAVSLGTAAIPILRALLFESDSAGIFEPRRRAALALAALRAYDVLREFVATWEPAADPVQRMGDEVALGAAARMLGGAPDPKVFAVLFAAARRHPVPGLIEALAHYRCAEAIPIFAKALEDDLMRAAAEEALRRLGCDALPALVEMASRTEIGPCGRETASEIRRRQSALNLIMELTLTADLWQSLRALVDHTDAEVAALACRIGIAVAEDAEKRNCAQKLVDLLERAKWPLRQEIEDCLSEHFASAREVVDRTLRDLADNGTARSSIRRSLQKIQMKSSSSTA
jgi:hypothetical protein